MFTAVTSGLVQLCHRVAAMPKFVEGYFIAVWTDTDPKQKCNLFNKVIYVTKSIKSHAGQTAFYSIFVSHNCC
jgi:hypothetical protein